MPRKQLTPAQLTFIKAVSTPGTTQHDAYKLAYPNAKQPDNDASKLMKQSYIQRAIDKIVTNRVVTAIGTPERAIEMIAGVAEIDYDDYQDRRNIKGIELLAKQHGLLIDKTDNTHRLETTMSQVAAQMQADRENRRISAPNDGQGCTQNNKER